MDNFLAKFRPDNRMNVGVSVSPTSGLEVIVVDPVQGKVTKYAQRQLTYNTSNREVEDYAEFSQLLTDLFKELKISPKDTNVVLNLPSVCFGHISLPLTLDDESIVTAITAEVEQGYLFKKNAPIVSWQEVKKNNTTESRYILYSAIQEGVVDAFRQIFEQIGANLIAIENSFSSLIKTLNFTNVTKEYAQSGDAWNILLVTQNSYAVFSLLEYNILEYYEDPLAIKSFNGDEVYIAISQAATSVLKKYPTDKLLIISESDQVSAEILAIQLKQPGDVTFLECNQFSSMPIMEVDLNVMPAYVKGLKPEAIGAAIYRAKDFPIKMNFLKTETVKESTLVNVLGLSLTVEQLYAYVVILALIIFGACFIASLSVGKYKDGLDAQKSALESEKQELDVKLTELTKTKNKIDIYAIAKGIDKRMVQKILYYNAIGADIPAKVWLTSFYADDKGGYGIEGQTTSVDDVYLFYRNIKSQVPESDLVLSTLSVDDKGGLIDIETTQNADYSFALSNSKYTPKKKKEDKKQSSESANGENMEVPNLPNLPN